jgi:ATP synthase F1 complex assembly factor 2
VVGGRCRLLGTAAEASPDGEGARGGGGGSDDAIYVKKPSAAAAVTTRDETSVAMPTSFMTGSVVGKRFYRDATVRRADDGNGWTVMLDYRTLKSPAKRPLKLPSRALAMAIAAEWEYQVLIPSLPFSCCILEMVRQHQVTLVQWKSLQAAIRVDLMTYSCIFASNFKWFGWKKYLISA